MATTAPASSTTEAGIATTDTANADFAAPGVAKDAVPTTA
jgi:hypothetical protein